MAQTEFDVKFTSNPTLDKITEEMKKTLPDWQRIVHIFKGTEAYTRHKYNNDNLIDLLAELHLSTFLSEISTRHKQMFMNPIHDGEERGKYRFKRVRLGSYTVFNLLTKQTCANYDGLTLIGDLPVVWQVKIAKQTEKNHGKVNKTLKPERVNEMFAPLVDCFKRNTFGCVVMVRQYEDIAGVTLEVSPYRQAFIEHGGILLPFYTSLEQFKEEVSNIRERYRL